MTENNQPNNAVALPPEAILPQMILGGLMQKSIWVAAKLGIADLLAEKPRTAEELSAATDTHAPSLYRVAPRHLNRWADIGFIIVPVDNTLFKHPYYSFTGEKKR